MKLRDFDTLSKTSQYEILLEKAVYLTNRSDERFNYILYQIDGFYIEVKFDLSANDFIMYRAFDNLYDLEPYLNAIDLQSVLC